MKEINVKGNAVPKNFQPEKLTATLWDDGLGRPVKHHYAYSVLAEDCFYHIYESEPTGRSRIWGEAWLRWNSGGTCN